jgi:hypothetical protein
MYYLEHCLRAAGVTSADAVAILHTSDEPWVYGDLRAELLDAFPGAAVSVTAPDAVPPGTDLVVVPFTDPPAFPQQDVVRLHLGELDAWARRLPRDASILLYRAAWREMEVVRPGRLRATVRRKRREAAALRLLDRLPLLRHALRPLY